MYSVDELRKADPELCTVIDKELRRQQNKIELIASENFVSPAVMSAMGSWLTNKYAEGYPGKRYYGGCEEVDVAETLACERAKALFGAEHANVQPHSGASANIAVFFAVLEPEDTVMGMNLSHGGHLTHGSPVNISGKYFKIVPYGVARDTGFIDYDELRKIALESRPKMIIAGGSAYPRAIDFEKFSEVAKEVGAYLMVDMAHIAGLVATGHHQSPVPYADFVTSTTHKTLRGPRGGLILCKEEHAKAIDKAVFPGIQGGPLMHIIAAKAVSFKEAMDVSFKDYIGKVIRNASAFGTALASHGFNLSSGGTDTHLLLVDLQNMNITGKEAERRLDEIGITCNKNTVPFDPKSPFVTSGIRLGTPAVTSRGFNEDDIRETAKIIAMVIQDFDNSRAEAEKRVGSLLAKYELY